MVGFFVEIKIVKNTIEVSTRSSIEFLLRRGSTQLSLNGTKNAFLGTMSAFIDFSTQVKGIVIVTVAVNTVGVKFLSTLFVLYLEEAASC